MTTREQNDAKSKYWEVAVDYLRDGQNRINSYLRLGTAEANPLTESTTADMDATATAQRGHDLAAMVQEFIDDGRQRGPHLPTQATRTSETANLHSKGGWRDHSDGNRISTTRGDKVEVIRGNYRIVVLGRQDEVDNCAEFDLSGGLLQDGDISPGSITEIKWEQNPWTGTWTVTEEAAKGNVISKYHGNVKEEFYGDTIETVMGSPGGAVPFVGSGWTDGDAAAPQKKSNPVITETTYATSITSTTDVSAAIVENTTVAGAVVENTAIGGAKVENTTVGGALNSNTAAGAIVDTMATAFYLEASVVATAKIELEVQLGHVQFEAAVFSFDMFLGVSMEVRVGPKFEAEFGGTTDLRDTSTSVAATQTTATGTTTQVQGNSTAVQGSSTAVQGSSTAVQGSSTQVASTNTQVSATQNTVTALSNTTP